MVAEFLPKPTQNSGDSAVAPIILRLLPAALVDHIAPISTKQRTKPKPNPNFSSSFLIH
ncbi:hypothetical protein HanRHA438_Chr16g0747981 [Helianthus annuus]|nr:hypothetical protein HanRHA438_Chr16g0747981 [Helianthus annuus]